MRRSLYAAAALAVASCGSSVDSARINPGFCHAVLTIEEGRMYSGDVPSEGRHDLSNAKSTYFRLYRERHPIRFSNNLAANINASPDQLARYQQEARAMPGEEVSAYANACVRRVGDDWPSRDW